MGKVFFFYLSAFVVQIHESFSLTRLSPSELEFQATFVRDNQVYTQFLIVLFFAFFSGVRNTECVTD